MARFVSALDWTTFAPRPIDLDLHLHEEGASALSAPLPILPFGCADERQGLVWLLRDARVPRAAAPLPPAEILLPELPAGCYRATFWDTWQGRPIGERSFVAGRGRPHLALPCFGRDLALTFQAERRERGIKIA
jgi:hypothetical protein